MTFYNHRFNTFGAALIESENEEVLTEVLTVVKRFLGDDVMPHSAICDGAFAFSNSIENVWPECVVRMCAFHVIKDVIHYAKTKGGVSTEDCNQYYPYLHRMMRAQRCHPLK